MRDVWVACEAAGIDPPEEVSEFFDFESPDSKGVIIDLRDKRNLVDYGAVTEYKGNDAEGFEVEIAKLPTDVKIIRFYNSW